MNIPRPALVADSVAIDADLRAVPLVATTAMLWAYTASTYAYKTWYIAGAGAVAVTLLVVLSGAARTAGLGRAIVPVLVYFGALLVSATWAAYPLVTLRWLAIDSIDIVVFALAFITGRNSTPRAITLAMTTFAIPAVLVTAVTYAVQPNATRIAQYAVALVAVLPPFLYWRIVQRRGPWIAAFALATNFAVLILGRSRTPLAVAIGLTLLTAFVLRDDLRRATRDAILCATVAIAIVVVLLLVPPTRIAVMKMFVRITAEKPNFERIALREISMAMLPERMPLGIGYRNFSLYYCALMGYEAPLHNMYVIWLLEGGLPGVAAALFLGGRHVQSLRRGLRHARDREERGYVQACAIATVGLLVVGFFHQEHQAPVFWLILGLTAAAARRDETATDDAPALLASWRRSHPPFAPALCEPLMSTALAHLSQSPPGALVLDVGCGNGFMLDVFRREDHRAIGIDADALTLVRNVRGVVAADGQSLPLRSESIDAIFVFSAFQYMDRERALAECRRVLRPGGRFAVIENLADNPFTAFSRVVRRLRGIRYSRFMEPHAHLRWRERAIYERHFRDVTYEAHHVAAPLFLLSNALAPDAAATRRNRVIVAALRVLQRIERRLLAGGFFRGAAWHLVVCGRK